MTNQQSSFGSNEGSQYLFSLRNKKKISLNYLQYPLLSGAPDNILDFFYYHYTCHKNIFCDQLRKVFRLGDSMRVTTYRNRHF